MNTPLDRFEYEPLDGSIHQFRLLRLLRSPGHGNIECDLINCRFNDTPYTALSYAWGDPSFVEPIQVNGKAFWITDNLYAALRHLRLPHYDRMLWVDAICIDQGGADDKSQQERTQQVREMRRIYFNAETVLIWLGKTTREADFLLDELGGFEQRASGRISNVNHSTPRHLAAFLGSSGGQDALDKMRTGLEELLSRSWFKRIWTIQEAANARSAVICASGKVIRASTFIAATLALDVQVDSYCNERLNLMLPSKPSAPNASEAVDLFSLIHQFRHSEATDQRDKIYALLGITTDPRDVDTISPDYKINLEDVIQKTMIHFTDTKLVAFERVLDLLPSFRGITAVALVVLPYHPHHKPRALAYGRPTREALLIMFESLKSRDAKPLLRIELEKTKGTESHTCFDEVNRLQETKDPRTRNKRIIGFDATEDNVQVYTWSEDAAKVKILFINNLEQAMGTPDLWEYNHVMEWLIHQGPNLGADEDFNNKAFVTAVSLSKVNYMRLLISIGVDTNFCTVEGRRAIHFAASNGNELVMDIMINVGANINALDAQNRTPLQEAVHSGHARIVETLVKAGADVNAPASKFRGNALQLARQRGYSEIEEILLRNGAVE